ncbi:MAG: peptidase M42, partial [Anaerolineales bacterium]|nr:peptidase M42 [Anaerolineales bacterium]
MTLPSIDTPAMLDFLTGLLNIPSPTGFTDQAIAYTEKALQQFPFLELHRTRKGGLVATWSGTHANAPRALTAHVDTLGAMVKEIKSNGRLKLTRIGGFGWSSAEGEGCTVFATNGEQVRGAILLTKASGHVYGSQFTETKRDDDNMEVRLDARTT